MSPGRRLAHTAAPGTSAPAATPAGCRVSERVAEAGSRGGARSAVGAAGPCRPGHSDAPSSAPRGAVSARLSARRTARPSWSASSRARSRLHSDGGRLAEGACAPPGRAGGRWPRAVEGADERPRGSWAGRPCPHRKQEPPASLCRRARRSGERGGAQTL